MEYRAPGTKYDYISKCEQSKYAPYDYKNKGILPQVLPKVITQTKNKTTQIVLQLIETTTIFLLKYVDELKYFKNWNYRLF